MAGVRYQDHPCIACSSPSYGYIKTVAAAGYLCESHFNNAYKRLFTIPLLTERAKRNHNAYKSGLNNSKEEA